MSKIIFYSTHCPKCNVLEKKLKNKNVSYEMIEDTSIMQQKGIKSLPVLEIDGIMNNFEQSVNYVNSL